MSKFSKVLTGLVLAAGLALAAPQAADAQHFHGGWHGGGWHGGGWHGGHWHGGGWGFGPGFALGYGIGAAPYYAYGPGDCGWVRVRVWRHGYWTLRRVWRCW